MSIPCSNNECQYNDGVRCQKDVLVIENMTCMSMKSMAEIEYKYCFSCDSKTPVTELKKYGTRKVCYNTLEYGIHQYIYP